MHLFTPTITKHTKNINANVTAVSGVPMYSLRKFTSNMKHKEYHHCIQQGTMMNSDECAARLHIVNNGTITSESPRVAATGMKRDLKVHQEAMLHQMINLEQSGIRLSEHCSLNTSIGVCGDMTGAGKSIEVLALIATHTEFSPSERVHSQFGHQVFIKACNRSAPHGSLVVAPHSCVSQWKRYIDEFTSLSSAIISKRKDIDTFNSDNYRDAVVCSSSMYNEFLGVHNMFWTRVFFDEADTIHIPAARSPRTNFTWFVTSSLTNLMFPSGSYIAPMSAPRGRPMITRKYIDGIRRNGYIRETFRNLETHRANEVMRVLCLKCDDDFVKQSFMLDEPIHYTVQCRTPHYVNVLAGLVSQEIMQMLNAGNVDGAVERAGCRIETSANIIENITHTYNERIANSKQELSLLEQMRYTLQSDEDTRQRRIKGIKEQLLTLENTVQSIESRLHSYGNTCSVCIDAYTRATVVSCCQNVFCFECITRCISMRGSCPMCRSKIGTPHLSVFGESSSSTGVPDLPDKHVALVGIMKKHQGGKFLVFSSHDQSFEYIEGALQHEKYNSSRLVGSAVRVNRTIERYRNESLDVLLLNSSHYGTGLNLENTTDLIFYHKMTSDMAKQVIGRAQRAGRTTPLRIHHLCQDNELA